MGFTQREWDRIVGIGSPPVDELDPKDGSPHLKEYELDKSTGELKVVDTQENKNDKASEEEHFDS